MRNTRWLRYGLAAIIVAGTGLGASLTACGDDDAASSSSGSLPDTGTPDTNVGDTGIKPDAADAAPKPNFAKLTFINATTDLGPSPVANPRGDAAIRICFKQGTTMANLGVAPYPPLPDKPKAPLPVAGIGYGLGGTFPSFGLDLESRIIVPIIMNVRSLVREGIVNPGTGQPGTTCDEIVGDTKKPTSNFVENVDFWQLPPIEAGTFKKEKSYVLALTGCTGDATIVNKEKCGPNPPVGGAPGVGNLKVVIFETNTTPVSATQLGVQFFHLSSPVAATFAPGAGDKPLTPGFMANPTDASTFKAAVPAPIVLHTLTAAQGVTGVLDSDFFVLDKANPNPLNPLALAPLPLPLIQALSGLGAATAPTIYKDGKNFVFVLVGDPGQPTFNGVDGGCADPNPAKCGDGGDGTTFNPQSVHFLAFPTDPVILPYTP